MSKIKSVELLFNPDENGISTWKTREEIIKYNPSLITSNGNFRQTREIDGKFYANCWNIDKYIWELKRKNNKGRGKVLKICMCGFSNIFSKKVSRPIKKEIRTELLKRYNGCIHCGNHKDLCIDHKNDLYNDDRVLDVNTQTIDDFQVLCNKCNKDLKHQANEKEKKTKIIHMVKDLNLIQFKFDKFEYPWEKCLRNYDVDIPYCKVYSYWYDIEEFNRKRHIFVMITRPINLYILKKVKLIE